MQSTPFCTSCGQSMRSGMAYCTSCGRPARRATIQPPGPQADAPSVAAVAAAPVMQAPPRALLPPPPASNTTTALTRPAPPKQRTSHAVPVVVETGAALYKVVKVSIGLVAIAIVLAGFIYDHSSEFKVKCAAHKAFGYDIGAIQNIVCDLDFTLK